jgi:hypothetical protein
MSKAPLLVVGDIDVGINWFDAEKAEEWKAELEKKVTKASPVPTQQSMASYWQGKQGVNQGTPRTGYSGYDWDDDYNGWCKGQKKEPKIHDMSEEEWKKAQEEEELAEWNRLMDEEAADEEMDEIEKANIRKAIGCG